MWKNRLGYGLMMAAFAVLVFFFWKKYLICLVIGLAVLLILLHVLLNEDAGHINVYFNMASGCQEGDQMKGVLSVRSSRRILAAQWITVKLETENKMFGVTEYHQLEVALKQQETQYAVQFPAEWCGVTSMICQSVYVEDIFRLFRKNLMPFETVSTTVYPRKCSVAVEISKTTIGAAWDEGRMQNKKGHDPSETFDIKEYAPGDDLRFVHWKLSGKADHLIMRQPSEPTHYHAVMLPDLGLTQADQMVTRQELNAAVAIGTALGEQMLRQGASFCVAIPRKDGLDICEVSSLREFQKVQQQWLGTPIASESGHGLEYFMLQHLEEHFTRLLIVSAGFYSKEMAFLEKRIGVTVVNTVSDAASVAASAQQDTEMIQIPADMDEKETYRIVC